jgi:hypothetical protein
MKPLPMFAAAEETLGAFVALAIVVWLFIQAYRRWVPERSPSEEASETASTVSADFEDGGEDHPLCLRCLTPHEPTAYFCPHCNAAVGPYNNWMPYLHIYSEGQWLRSAQTPPPRNPWLIRLGYGLLSLAVLGPLAPLVWLGWWLVRRPPASFPPARA